MYNVKGPSKIVAKTTRRGIPQNVDNNIREYARNKSVESDEIEVNGPKPVFHRKSTPSPHPEKVITPEHREIIQYVNESWNSVCSEVYQENSNSSDSSLSGKSDQSSSIFYQDGPCHSLTNFKPFDLESWWGKRLYAYLTESANGHN